MGDRSVRDLILFVEPYKEHCTHCHTDFEVTTKSADPILNQSVTCPNCFDKFPNRHTED